VTDSEEGKENGLVDQVSAGADKDAVRQGLMPKLTTLHYLETSRSDKVAPYPTKTDSSS